MSPPARHLSWRSPQNPAPALPVPYPHARSRFATVAALAVFLPVWLPGRLLVGDFSWAFVVPFVLALWALTRPAWPGAVRRALRGGYRRGLWLEVLCVGAILLLAAATMLFSPEPLRALRVILPMSYAICALVLLSRIPPLVQRRMVFAALFAGALALGFALLLTQTDSGRATVIRGYRFLAFFENPNQLGLMIVAVWPLAIALLLNAHSPNVRLLCAATVGILLATILMSGTKTALALCFVSGALLWFYHGSRSGSLGKTLVRLAVIAVAIVLAVPALLWLLNWASPAFFERVESILTHGVWAFPSMQTRGEIWKISFRIGLAHPLLGEGAGTSVYGYAHSHNMFLDYFRGMGIFALAAAVLLVLSAVSRGARFFLSTWRKGQTDRPSDTIIAGMYLGAIFYLVGNQLSDSFSPTTAFLFWMMYLGACLAESPAAVIVRQGRPRSTVGWTDRVPGRRPPSIAVAQPI